MTACSRGRIWYLAAFGLFVLFLFLRSRRNEWFVSEKYSKNGYGTGNSTLGFQSVLVINAPWRTDRKDSLTLAAVHTGISLDWIDGINSSTIDERAYPQGDHRSMAKGNLGSWRGHLNAVRMVVEKNLSTALILEDDVDWDPRIHSQLAAFGVASQKLPAMIANAESTAQDRVRTTEKSAKQISTSDTLELMKSYFSFAQSSQPYGNTWDILWLGHCGTYLAPHQSSRPFLAPADRLMLLNDATVPDPRNRTSPTTPPSPTDALFLPYTRVYHRSESTLCTLAYAVTQLGARKILYEHGIRNLDRGYDFALSEWCDGETAHMGDRPLCLTSSPPVFSHYWPERGEGGGGRSDIMGIGVDGVDWGRRQLVKSVRGSLENVVESGDL
ncbi:hypothetical protein GQ44DRAFT_422643 [Phaeosphaeriaceae sp. PMI808]|nr:hypothetical protein GQ44DRAFT_422643 [Phaeosphaeriaceae sp. PMI808]